MIDPIPLQADTPPPASRPAAFDRARAAEVAGWLLLLAAVLAVLFIATAPAPYAIEVPGSTTDTLGTAELGDGQEVELIGIEGAKAYPSDGTLSLVTVGVIGSPAKPPSWVDVIGAWFRPGVTAVPLETVFPPGSSSDDIAAEAAVQMELSQREAVAAALAELGIPFSSAVEVSSVLDDGPSAGLLEPGDLLVSIDGEAVEDSARLRELLDAHGTDGPAEVVVRRGGAELTLELTPATLPGSPGRPVLGVLVLPGFDFPFEVDIQLENVGGPSAGLMFALGVYDRLTPGALPGGERIAGTGTITADGAVGPVGGVRQKMHAAVRDGADWFLVPAGNCGQALAAALEGLVLVPVGSLDEAITVVGMIADSGTGAQELPSCTA